MKILGITGYKQSGKDTVLRCIKQLYPHLKVVRLNFADALKQEVAEACGVTVEHIEANKEKFRPILQWWGTDFRRNMTNTDYWVHKWDLALHQISVDLVVATDVRFPNEYNIIVEGCNGDVWRVTRQPNTDPHESEAGQQLIETPWPTIENTGTFAYLEDQVKFNFEITFPELAHGHH